MSAEDVLLVGGVAFLVLCFAVIFAAAWIEGGAVVYESTTTEHHYTAGEAAPTTSPSTPKPRPHMKGKKACDE